MAINTNDTKNSLFGGLKKAIKPVPQEEDLIQEKIFQEPEKETKQESSSPYISNPIEHNPDISTLPKWQTLDKVTTLLTSDQKEGLDRIAIKLMKYRSKQLKGLDNKERITANTLIRSLIDNFLELEDSLQFETLTSEKEVKKWIAKIFK
jgi:hypothetical protein